MDDNIRVWLQGFIEAVGDTPTKEQWAVLKKEVGKNYSLGIKSPYVSPNIPTTTWRFSDPTCGSSWSTK